MAKKRPFSCRTNTENPKGGGGGDGPILRTQVANQNARFVSSCSLADSALYKEIMPYFMAFLLPRNTHHCLDLFNSVLLFTAFLNFATLQLFFNLYRALPASLSPMVRLLFWRLEISSLKQLPAAYIIVCKSFLLFICSVNLPPQSPH